MIERKAEVGQKSSGGLRVCHVSDFIMSREARLRCNASIIHLSYIVISFRLTVLVFIISIETTRQPDGVKEQVTGFQSWNCHNVDARISGARNLVQYVHLDLKLIYITHIEIL